MTEQINKEHKEEKEPVAPQDPGQTDKGENNPPAPEEKSPEAKPEPGGTDYKAELEKERKRLEQAEYVIEKTKKENKELKEGKEEIPDEDLDDKLQKMLDAKLDGFKGEVNKVAVDSTIADFASNDDEAELIRFHYENSINRTSDVKADIENAKLLANRAKIMSENEELRAALSAKSSIGPSSAGANQDQPDNNTKVQLSAYDQKIIDRLNKRREARGEEQLTNKEIKDIINQ